MNITRTTSTNTNTTATASMAVITTSLLIVIIGLVGNGLIVYAYIRFRQLQTITNYFIFNLAVTDLLLVAGLASWVMIDLYPSDRLLEIVVVNIDVLCCSASMLSLTAASVDRYLAVTRPLRYEQLITRSRARKATLFIWVYSLIMFGLSVARYLMYKRVFDTVFMTTLTIMSFGIPALAMIFAHLSICRCAWNAKKRSRDIHGLSRRRSKDIAKGIKLSFNTLVILVPIVMAWGVFYMITVLEAHCPTCFIFPQAFSVTVGLLPHAVAAIDPIVYILVTRDLRRRLCKCFS
ncbi:beta-2 adrenergic receptor-like [Porites lutea]|uniref:beta-2 adrenergic receptor-like n=1 Tax=Porites lutea TaxID=51062 RepID=UPI003CC55470